MSVSLLWQPLAGKNLSVNGKSQTKEALERAFGSFPLELEGDAIPKLEGLRAGEPNNQAYDELIVAIHKHQRIQVRAEY